MRSCWKFPKYGKLLKLCLWFISKKTEINSKIEKFDDKYTFCDVIRGSFIMTNVNDFLLVGGFDEDTFLYYEENILFKKYERINKKPIILTDYFYIHNHNYKNNKSNSYKIKKYNFDSAYILLKKYYKSSKIQLCIYNLFRTIGLIEQKIVDLIKVYL